MSPHKFLSSFPKHRLSRAQALLCSLSFLSRVGLWKGAACCAPGPARFPHRWRGPSVGLLSQGLFFALLNCTAKELGSGEERVQDQSRRTVSLPREQSSGGACRELGSEAVTPCPGLAVELGARFLEKGKKQPWTACSWRLSLCSFLPGACLQKLGPSASGKARVSLSRACLAP